MPARKAGNKKINIATPAYKGEYTSAYVRSLYSLLTAAPSLGLRFSFSEIDYADIVTARNYLITNFYYNKPDCTHLLFLDADMGFPSKLISEMASLDEHMVGVIYPKRTINLETLHHLHGQPYAKAYAQACSFIGSPSEPHPRNPAFRKVQGCGTGILLIGRDCVATMIKRCPTMVDNTRFKHMPFAAKFNTFLTPFNKIELHDHELSEDLSFCQRWTKDCEGKIYANVTHDIEHTGNFTIKTCHANLL